MIKHLISKFIHLKLKFQPSISVHISESTSIKSLQVQNMLIGRLSLTARARENEIMRKMELREGEDERLREIKRVARIV